ncbi:hypothetical protein EST38_g2260 [Candolleomyces aberdarensis]|uniref:F-box domain-containing protein n=1 Tax=Candolleomyces aberdarensis TaxID=2316362 RepID=A0A4Q2DWF8_9AGAR|nr:hypothetical protein EST38_g2260 [Candolleomyces aberdarensis]
MLVLNSQQNPSRPHINRIPTELLVLVFEFLGVDWNSNLLILACRVCKHWRDILHAQARFWTSICAVFKDQFEEDPHQIFKNFVNCSKHWYGRAGDRPLTLRLLVGITNKRMWPFKILNDYLVSEHRWGELEFYVDDEGRNPMWFGNLIQTALNQRKKRPDRPCWPNLRVLKILASWGPLRSSVNLNLNEICPNLQELKLLVKQWEGCTLQNTIEQFPLASLTRLKFSGHTAGITIAFFFHALTHGKNLEYFAMLKVDPSQEALPPPPTGRTYPIVHNRIRHLAVANHVNVLKMLQNTTLPALATFKLQEGSDGGGQPIGSAMPEAIEALVNRSQCQILDLRVDKVLDKTGLLHLLRVLPTVRAVVLSNPHAWDPVGGIYDAIDKMDLLPNLRSILCKSENWYRRDDVDAFRRLVEGPGRFAGSDQIERVGSVEVLEMRTGWTGPPSRYDIEPKPPQKDPARGGEKGGLEEAFLMAGSGILYARIGSLW